MFILDNWVIVNKEGLYFKAFTEDTAPIWTTEKLDALKFKNLETCHKFINCGKYVFNSFLDVFASYI